MLLCISRWNLIFVIYFTNEYVHGFLLNINNNINPNCLRLSQNVLFYFPKLYVKLFSFFETTKNMFIIILLLFWYVLLWHIIFINWNLKKKKCFVVFIYTSRYPQHYLYYVVLIAKYVYILYILFHLLFIFGYYEGITNGDRLEDCAILVVKSEYSVLVVQMDGGIWEYEESRRCS